MNVKDHSSRVGFKRSGNIDGERLACIRDSP
jgi:hypothetical protein